MAEIVNLNKRRKRRGERAEREAEAATNRGAPRPHPRRAASAMPGRPERGRPRERRRQARHARPTGASLLEG